MILMMPEMSAPSTLLLPVILGIVYFCAARTNPKIILNDHTYKLHLKSNDRTYWKCVFAEKSKCKARFITTGSTVQIKEGSSQHNHQPNVVDYHATKVYFFAGRKNPQLILNNYVYTRHSKPSDRTYWECRSKKDSRCKSRITSKGNKIFFGEDHNHLPPPVNFNGLPFRTFFVVNRNKSEPDFHTFYYNMLCDEEKKDGGELVYFKIGLRQPQLIVRNYIFGMKNKSDRKTYWSCVSDRKTFCRAALTSHGQEIWIRENHNHDPPYICLDGLRCRKFYVKHQKTQGCYNYNYYFRNST